MATIEILGLIATLFVLISFLFKNLLVVRCINIVGCICFVIYGAILGAWSVWILNGALAIVHIVYLSIDFYKKKSKNRK